MSLKPYPEYRKSGVEWIDAVPAEWPVLPLRRIASVVNGGTPTPHEENWGGTVPWATPVDLNHFDGKQITSTLRTLTSQGLLSGSSIVPEGSVVLSTRAPIGYVARAASATAFNQGCKGLIPHIGTIDSKFLVYVLLSAKIELTSRGQGTTFLELSTSTLMSIQIPVPPIELQRKISAYLDFETAEIDAFIVDQEKLIKLLGERRTATLTRAVTKGLDPNAAMKDSGLTWIGEVPEHWRLSKLGHHYEVVLGKMLDGAKEPPLGARKLPYVRAGNIQDTGLDLSDVNEMAFTSYEAERLNLIAKDLLVVEGGSVGTVHYLDSAMDGWSFQKTVNRVRSLGSADTKYLGHLIRMFRDAEVFEVICNGSTIMHLTAEKLRALTIPLPDIGEQRSIAEFIDHEIAEIDATIAEAREAITFSKERRAAVISAAVTGKIDVRRALATAANMVGVDTVGVA
ncbi:restriction endonuclease subunit S [Paeniglutamicibacter sp. R2-26]|uniref:restriction endonuclease subunit S n=1 Tax=Paeniglutamicibacter sp. R2-26 TaxID=3144417 RepID=UPI003EE7608E